MGVQACRLPALKPLKPLNRLKPLKPLKTLKPVKRLMGVQACRLPALKCHRLNNPLACFILQPTGTQGHTSMASYRCPSLPFASP